MDVEFKDQTIMITYFNDCGLFLIWIELENVQTRKVLKPQPQNSSLTMPLNIKVLHW